MCGIKSGQAGSVPAEAIDLEDDDRDEVTGALNVVRGGKAGRTAGASSATRAGARNIQQHLTVIRTPRNALVSAVGQE